MRQVRLYLKERFLVVIHLTIPVSAPTGIFQTLNLIRQISFSSKYQMFTP